MILANREKIVELQKLENEYFNLKGTVATETSRCTLRGQLVKGFVKSEEMVDEAIQKITKEIEMLKKQNEEKELLKKQNEIEILEENKKRGFANLIGSEKQIKWANDLRLQLIEKVDKIKEESKKDNGLEVLKLHFSYNNIENASIELIEQALKYILSTKTNATYYIDNRYSNIFDILVTEIKNMQKEVK